MYVIEKDGVGQVRGTLNNPYSSYFVKVLQTFQLPEKRFGILLKGVFFKPSFCVGSRTDGLQGVLASIQKRISKGKTHSSCWGRFHAVVFNSLLPLCSFRSQNGLLYQIDPSPSFRRRKPSRIPPTHR